MRHLLALTLLLVACGEQGGLELPAPPELPRVRAAASGELLRVEQTPRDVQLAQLERELVELEAWSRAEARPPAEQMRRWQELRARAADTDYAVVADSRIAALEHTATNAQPHVLSRGLCACLDRHWETGLELLDGYLETYRGHAAAAQVAEMRAAAVAQREALRGAMVLRVGLSGSNNKDLVARSFSSGRGWRLRGIQPQGRAGIAGAKLLLQAGSGVTWELQLATVPAKGYLLLRHFSPFAGGQHSPISVVLNRRLVAGNYNPVGLEHSFWTAWDVTAALQPGANELTIFCDGTSSNVYWLYGFELRDLDPRPLLTPR